MKMEPLEVPPGEVIVQQGDEGDYFYTIHEGSCRVTRCEQPGGDEVELAILANGDSFGEEALVSDVRRNATITMQTPGLLMRLAKEDFDGLLKTQLIRSVTFDEAVPLVDQGAVWLDVRTEDEYACGALEDSVNLPLASLRGEMPELVLNSLYIVYCDTGNRSDSAAFVLSHKGYDVCVLQGGTASVPVEVLVDGADVAGHVVDADAGNSEPVQFNEPGIRHEADTLRQSNQEMSGLVLRLRAERDQLVEQVEQLRGELSDSAERLAQMYERINTEAAERDKMRKEHEARIQAYENELSEMAEQQAQTQGGAPHRTANLAALEVALQQSLATSAASMQRSEELHKQLREQYESARKALHQCSDSNSVKQ